MSAVNPIDRAMDLLCRAHLPPDLPANAFQQLLDELRTLKQNGVTENSLHCPAPGCGYVCFASPGAGVDQPDVCPHHGVPLHLMTWKQMAERAFGAARNQAEQFDQAIEEANRINRAAVERACQDRREALARLDDNWFEHACAREELDRLQEIHSGPIGSFARRLDQHFLEHRMCPETPTELLAGIHSCLDRIKLAMGKNNRLAVDNYTAELAGYAMKLSQIYTT